MVESEKISDEFDESSNEERELTRDERNRLSAENSVKNFRLHIAERQENLKKHGINRHPLLLLHG